MRVTAFHVDGFGLLHDIDVEGIGPGTTVVLGPNESGKSTLHAFLARTLFGHPRRNDARGRRRLAPLRGGHHGGWVAVDDEDGGHWVVHRSTSRTPRLRVVDPDGVERTGPDALDGLVPTGVDLDRFEQVHAIDLDALTGLGPLEGQALQDLLFDAATVGAGLSLRAARTAATAERDGLWTPLATARPLSVALADRDEARSALRAARAEAAEFADVQRARDDVAAGMGRLDEERAELVAERALLDRVVQAWPVRQRLAEAAAEEVALEGDELPTGLVTQVREEEAARVAAVVDVDRLEHAVGAAGRSEDPTALDDRLAADADEVLGAHARLSTHRTDVDRLGRAAGAAREAAAVLGEAMEALGPGWDLRRVAGVRTDAPTCERVRVAGTELLEARRRRVDAARHRDELAAAVERRRLALERRREARKEPPPAAQVSRAEEAVALLRAHVAAGGGAAVTESRPVLGALRELPRWSGWALLAAAAVLVVLAISTADGSVSPLVLVVVVLLVTAPIGFVVGRALANRRTDEQRVAPAEPSAAVADAARLLGVASPLTRHEVERVAGTVAAARASIELAAQSADELRELEVALEAEQQDASRAARQAEDATAAVASAERTWREVCGAAGLPTDEPPQVVTVLHDRVVAAARAASVRARVEEERADRAAAVDRFRAEVEELLARAVPDAAGADEDAISLLDRVARRIRDVAGRRSEHAADRGRRSALRRELERARTRVATATERRDRGLSSAGVADLDEFEERAARDELRRDAAARRAAAGARLTELLGVGPTAAEAKKLLDGGDAIAWEARRASVGDRLLAIAEARDEALREHTLLARRVEELGGDDAVPRAAQRLAAAQAEVDRLATRWVVADGAARLLDDAVTGFERDQHPRVLVDAGRLLEIATLGAWSIVRQREGELVASRTSDGETVSVDDLSRGTQEQLYLCLRLALAYDRTEADGTSLPLLVDDLLGTTDPERGAAVTRLLAAFARRQQVWLFTCDPRIPALVRAADPSARVLELAPGGQAAEWSADSRLPATDPPDAPPRRG